MAGSGRYIDDNDNFNSTEKIKALVLKTLLYLLQRKQNGNARQNHHRQETVS